MSVEDGTDTTEEDTDRDSTLVPCGIDRQEGATIACLPVEIISMILKYSDYHDILNFGSTCKLFNDIVKSDRCLWKDRFREL